MLNIGDIVDGKLFIGYLMVACDSNATKIETMFENLGFTKDREKLMSYVRSKVKFRYLFADFKDRQIKETNVFSTLPLEEEIKVEDSIGEEQGVEIANQLAQTNCVWKNGLRLDLFKVQLYRQRDIEKYFNQQIDTYLRYCSVQEQIEKGVNPADALFSTEKDKIYNDIMNLGYYRVGYTGFIVRTSKKYMLMIMRDNSQEKKVLSYLKEKKGRRPKGLMPTKLVCSLKESDEKLKNFYFACNMLISELEH